MKNIVPELSGYDSCHLVHFCILMPGDALQANQCLVQGEIKGCHVKLEIGLWLK